MHRADDLADDTLRVGRTFTGPHELTDAERAAIDRGDLVADEQAAEQAAATRERAIIAAMEAVAGAPHLEAPPQRAGGGIAVSNMDQVPAWPGEYDPNDPAEPGPELRRLNMEWQHEQARQHEEREHRRHVREHRDHRPAKVPPAELQVRMARPRGAGRPRASASRSSAKSGDGGSDSSKGDGEPPPPGPSALAGPSPRFSRPWRPSVEATVVDLLGGRGTEPAQNHHTSHSGHLYGGDQ